MSFSDFRSFLKLKKPQVNSILKILSPISLFPSRTFCTYKMLKFGANRKSFGEKIMEKLSFSDLRPFLTLKKPRVKSNLIIFSPNPLFLSRTLCTYKILKFCANRKSFGVKIKNWRFRTFGIFEPKKASG